MNDETKHLESCHKTTMFADQRKELIRVVTVKFEGAKDLVTIEQAAAMTDRQLHLTWLHMCQYISEATYRREFNL